MTTPIFVTGWEHGVNPVASGGGLASGISGTSGTEVAVTNNPVHSGAYALRVAPTASTAGRWYWTVATPTALVARFYLYLESAPSSSTFLFSFVPTAGNVIYLWINDNTNNFELRDGALNVIAVGPAYTVGQFYLVDWKADVSANPWAVYCKINGGAEFGGTVATAATTFARFSFGTTSTTGPAWSAIMDDLVLSITLADYPIGPGGTEGLLPSSDGTHNSGANIMEDETGADIPSATTAYDKINTVPLLDATHYIQQAPIGTGNYAEVNFANISATHLGIIGGMAVLAYTSATTTANAAGCLVSKDGFSTSTTVWGAPGAQADYSDGSTAAPYYKSAIIAGVSDDTTVNALAARVGYASDATPDPYWINLIVEVAYSTAAAKAFATSINSASSTPDTAAAAVARALAASLASTSSAPDAAVASIARGLAAALASESSTPDTVTLTIQTIIAFATSIVSGTSTPDVTALAITRAMAATMASGSSTPDDVTLGIAGWITFAASIASISSTPNAAMTVARALATGITSTSGTPDVVLAVQRTLSAISISSASSTPAAAMAIARGLNAAMASGSMTPDDVALLVAGIIDLATAIASRSTTPDTIDLTIVIATGLLVLAVSARQPGVNATWAGPVISATATAPNISFEEG